MHIEVETRNVDGQVTALGSAGQFTLVVDRPAEGRGGGLRGEDLPRTGVFPCVEQGTFSYPRSTR
jgi:putative redox protein